MGQAFPSTVRRKTWLEHYRDRRSYSRERLAKASGVSFGQITKLELGERNLTQTVARRLAPALGVHWKCLFKGPGAERSDFDPALAEPAELAGPADLALRNERPAMVEVPEVDPNAMAGDGGSIEVPTERLEEIRTGLYGFPAASFRDLFGAAPDRVVILAVKGDSMAPTFLPGQRVMVDLGDKRPSPPGVFMLWDGLGTIIKRVEFIPFSDPGRVRIISDNAKHAPYERLLDEAHIQGRVIGAWERR